MKKNTETIKVPSFNFSREFITELKQLLESERNGIVIKLEKDIKKEKSDVKKILLQYNVDDYSISYSLKYKDEVTNSPSIDELFQLIAPRTEFENFSVRIQSYRDKSFLDIYMRISTDYPDNSELQLSCDDKDKIIVAKDKFKRLFKNNKNSYSFYYRLPFLWRSILVASLIFIFSIFIIAGLDKLYHISSNLTGLIFYNVLGISAIIYYKIVPKYFIPYIKFKDINKLGFFGFLVAGFVTIFWSFIYDLIKGLIGSKWN